MIVATHFFQALWTNPFLQMALFVGLLSSIAGGVIGSYVVVKRIVFIAGSIAHSVLGGLGLFLFLSRTYHLPIFNPLIGALIFAILSALLIGWIHLNYQQREDTVIAAIWASGMAIGVIFIALTPGHNVELLNFLFGNILWSTRADLYLLCILDALVILITSIFHKQLLSICFDETQSYLQKIPVKTYTYLLLSLVAITVVILIQAIGAILIIAILSLPAATANLFTYRLSHMILFAVALSWIFTFLGIYASYSLNWPPGATIALISTLGYFISLPITKVRKA